MPKKQRRPLLFILAAFTILLLIQAIPYGRNHDPRPVVRELSWNSAATRDLAKRACFDCHSYETTWPWYSRIAPVSWLVQHDVDEGVSELNFSDWRSGARKGERPDKIRKEVEHGEMPPILYRLAHPQARLSQTQQSDLINGLVNSARNSSGGRVSPPVPSPPAAF